MTKKVNPQLFRIKNYNLSNSKYINFFDSLDQYYLIKRNLYFFIKYFTKFKIFIFNFKLQRNNFKIFKIFFFGFFLKKLKFFFFLKTFFFKRKKKNNNNNNKKKTILKLKKKLKKKKKKKFITKL